MRNIDITGVLLVLAILALIAVEIYLMGSLPV